MTELYTYLTSFESGTVFLLSALQDFGLIALVISVFLLGEFVIVTALILTQQGVLSVFDVVIASLIGTLLADAFWFGVGRHRPQRFTPPILKRYFLQPTNDLLDRIILGRYFIALLIFSFFIGTRLMILLYLSQKPISWLRFIVYDAIGTLLYILVFSGLGIFLGQAIRDVFPVYKSIGSIVFGVLIVVLISILSRQALSALSKKRTGLTLAQAMSDKTKGDTDH